jgi:hypothetical protein
MNRPLCALRFALCALLLTACSPAGSGSASGFRGVAVATPMAKPAIVLKDVRRKDGRRKSARAGERAPASPPKRSSKATTAAAAVRPDNRAKPAKPAKQTSQAKRAKPVSNGRATARRAGRGAK